MSWWKEAVFYQIYPRSFNDPSLETTEETWTVARTGLTRLARRAADG